MKSARSVDAKLAKSAPLFAALGDRTRLQLVARLSNDGPMPIAKLAGGARMSRQAITKHLQVLERAGLARSARKGREKVWRLHRERFSEARRYLKEISHQWDASIERLRALVEDAGE